MRAGKAIARRACNPVIDWSSPLPRLSLNQSLSNQFVDIPYITTRSCTSDPESTQQSERQIIDELGDRLGIRRGDFEAWYKVTAKDFRSHAAASSLLYGKYNGSIIGTLQSVLPEHKWEPLRLHSKPKRFWTSLDNQREFLLNIGKAFGIKEGDFDAWYKIKKSDVLKQRGSRFLYQRDGTLASALKAVFPEHDWDDSKFEQKPKNFWSSVENQRAFMQGLAKKLKFKEGDLSAWYQLTVRHVTKNGGGTLLIHNHKGSILNLLRTVFPDHVWDESRFAKKRQSYWATPENQKAFLLSVGSKLGIDEENYEAWYDVRPRELSSFGARSLIKRYGTFAKLVMTVFPEHPWEPWRFVRARTPNIKAEMASRQ